MTKPSKPLKIRVTKATGLPKGSMFDKLDPYCVVRLRGAEVFMKTQVMNNAGSNPVWDFEGELPYYGDEEALDFEVLDSDMASADDLVATGSLPVANFTQGFEGVVKMKLEGKPKKGKEPGVADL